MVTRNFRRQFLDMYTYTHVKRFLPPKLHFYDGFTFEAYTFPVDNDD